MAQCGLADVFPPTGSAPVSRICLGYSLPFAVHHLRRSFFVAVDIICCPGILSIRISRYLPVGWNAISLEICIRQYHGAGSLLRGKLTTSSANLLMQRYQHQNELRGSQALKRTRVNEKGTCLWDKTRSDRG